MRRTVVAVLLTLLCLGLFSSSPILKQAKAWTGTVLIRADGSIDPVDGPIMTTNGFSYALTDDIDGSIVVQRDNIMLDGMGHKIQGSGIDDGQTGVYCLERNNVSLRDIVVKGFDVGISFLEGVSNNSILESVIADNYVGLEFDESYGTVVSGNTIQNNSQGILFSYMWSGANVSNNIIIGNDRGISFNPYGGGEAIISRNRIEKNNIGIESRLSSNIISGNSIRDCDTGIELCGNPSLIEMNEIINNTIGLNMIYGTDHYGEIYASNHSVITRNTFHGNMKGVYFHGSSYNNMTDNVIVGNGLGVAFEDQLTYQGWTMHSEHNIIAGNNIEDNNEYGVQIINSSENHFYHNTLVNQDQVNLASSTDTWDNGYPSGGNYWSSYAGTDANYDGIGDTEYVINGSNRDRYPLMSPWDQAVFMDDSFESGGFGVWNGTLVSSGELAMIVDSTSHHGVWSAKFTSNSGGGYENSCVSMTLARSEIYARGCFYVTRSGIDADNDRFFFIIFKSGSYGLAYAGWKRIGGALKWCITLRDGTSFVDIYSSSSSPSISRWYCVELHWAKDHQFGVVEMWVDGILVCSSQGRNTASYGDVAQVQIGLAELYGCGNTEVYSDCVIIANRYVGRDTLSPLTFRDGFESGSYSKWSGTSGTAVTSSTQEHHGTYSAKFTTNGGGGYEQSFSYNLIDPSPDLYARGYFYVSQSGITTNGDRAYFIIFRASGNNMAYVGWRMSGGAARWWLTLRQGTSIVEVESSSMNPSTGRWYCVELHWVKHPSNGHAEMWVDGDLVCSSSEGDTSTVGGITQVRFGLAEAKAGSTTVYCDCAIVSSDYIGPEAGSIASSLSISVSTNLTTIKLGAMISGYLAPAGSAKDVSIKYRFAGSGSWSTLATVGTNTSGAYSYMWTPAQVASYELMASWAGDSQVAPSDSQVIEVDCLRLETRVSMSTSPSTSVAGFRISATGRLIDEYGNPLQNEAVFLHCRTNGFPDVIISGSSDSSGHYSMFWIPFSTGHYSLKTSWDGNATYRNASITIALDCLTYGQQVISVESNSSTSLLAFDGTDRALHFSVEGPSGTNGYARIKVAKNMVNDPSDVRIVLDGVDRVFTMSSTDDSWLLTFDYSHSTHQVKVDLDITAIPEFPGLGIIPLVMMATLFVAMLSRKRRLHS